MNFKQVKELATKHQEIRAKILDMLAEADVPPTEGEALLLYIAGMSAGIRGGGITGPWVEPATIGWTFGAGDIGG